MRAQKLSKDPNECWAISTNIALTPCINFGGNKAKGIGQGSSEVEIGFFFVLEKKF